MPAFPGSEFLWLLLPVAAASGFWFARRSDGVAGESRRSERDTRYVEGINHLLNEQPDKAVESFIHLLETDADTAATHLALGNLYRRRGEVENAIRIHQSLVGRDELEPTQRRDAKLELAQDFLSAGLLDRAEDLYQQLAGHRACEVQALRQLIDIYEQEKDWPQAITAARKLERATGNRLGHVVAQYHCELSRQQQRRSDFDGALAAVQAALEAHADCVRASLLEGDLLFDRGEHTRALLAYQRVERQQPEYLPESVPRAAACFRALGRPGEMRAWLNELFERRASVSAVLELVDLEREQSGPAAAAELLGRSLATRLSLRAVERLVELENARDDRTPTPHLPILEQLAARLAAGGANYSCAQCGFEAKSLHWQCPGCKSWSSARPAHSDG